MECPCRVIGEHLLKFAENIAALTEAFRKIRLVIADRIFDEFIHSPAVSLRIPVQRGAVFRHDNGQRLPLRIPAACQDFFFQESGHMNDILHQFIRFQKDIGVNPLQDIPPGFSSLFCLDNHRVIDMTAVIIVKRNRFSGEIKMLRCRAIVL